MAFSEAVTKEIRRKSHFQCCLCKALGVEIHHVIPQAEGGPDTLENAAPLCPSCHETYGANPTKRKFIREARDFWFEVCEKRYQSDASLLQKVQETIGNTASKDDVYLLRSEIINALNSIKTTKAPYNISIPLNQNDNDDYHLSSRDLIILVTATSSHRPIGQLEILCMRELWPVAQGYRKAYKDFCQIYGERMLRYMAARALDAIDVDVDDEGLSEGEIVEAFALMSVEVICFVLFANGALRAKLNHDNEIAWWASN